MFCFWKYILSVFMSSSSPPPPSISTADKEGRPFICLLSDDDVWCLLYACGGRPDLRSCWMLFIVLRRLRTAALIIRQCTLLSIHLQRQKKSGNRGCLFLCDTWQNGYTRILFFFWFYGELKMNLAMRGLHVFVLFTQSVWRQIHVWYLKNGYPREFRQEMIWWRWKFIVLIDLVTMIIHCTYWFGDDENSLYLLVFNGILMMLDTLVLLLFFLSLSCSWCLEADICVAVLAQ